MSLGRIDKMRTQVVGFMGEGVFRDIVARSQLAVVRTLASRVSVDKDRIRITERNQAVILGDAYRMGLGREANRVCGLDALRRVLQRGVNRRLVAQVRWRVARYRLRQLFRLVYPIPFTGEFAVRQ